MRAADVDKLKRDIVEFKTSFQSTNQDYMTGYISALSVVEGMKATKPDAFCSYGERKGCDEDG